MADIKKKMEDMAITTSNNFFKCVYDSVRVHSPLQPLASGFEYLNAMVTKNRCLERQLTNNIAEYDSVARDSINIL